MCHALPRQLPTARAGRIATPGHQQPAMSGLFEDG